jgi:hypothetical protein
MEGKEAKYLRMEAENKGEAGSSRKAHKLSVLHPMDVT